ncbi:MAG: Abi family protein [Paraclostridium sp.]|uniref:Abi family protein n=1 Tax=Romboutsia sp. TaxID=1965302 RepID=UPI003F37E26F
MKLKKARTYDDQIGILKSRGLIIENEEFAKSILKNIGYYKLSGFYKFFYKDIKDNTEREFKDGIKFEDIYNLYLLDKELRNLLFSIITDVEISFKANIAYVTSHKYGVEAWKDSKVLSDEVRLFIRNELGKSKKNPIIKHHIDNYEGKYPIWVVMEILSFGTVSKMYQSLPVDDKKEIAKVYYNHKHQYIEQWMESITNLRNKCAHHERVIGESINIKTDKSMKGYKVGSLFIVILAFKQLVTDHIQWSLFMDKLLVIVDKYEFNKLDLIGFPENWNEIL